MFLPFCLSFSLSLCVSLSPSIYRATFLAIYLSTCLFTYLSIDLFIHLSIKLSIFLSIQPFIHPLTSLCSFSFFRPSLHRSMSTAIHHHVLRSVLYRFIHASVQILFKSPTPAIVFENATKPSRFSHFSVDAQSTPPTTQNNV